MIQGFKRVAASFKAGTDKEFWLYVMDAENMDVKDIQNRLAVLDSSLPYLYVVDNKGRIVLALSGKYSDVKMEAIEDAIE